MSNYSYLLHGFYQSSWVWDDLIKNLEDKISYKIVAPDLLGFGSKKVNKVTYYDQAQEIIHSIPQDVEKVSFLAHSSSGTTLAMILELLSNEFVGYQIQHAIFLDASILDSGKSVIDGKDLETRTRLEKESSQNSGFIQPKLPIVQQSLFTSINKEDVEKFYFPKLEPVPFSLYTDKQNLDSFYALKTSEQKRIYIECLKSNRGNYRKDTARKINAEYKPLNSDHQVMITNPELLSELLLTLFTKDSQEKNFKS